MQRRAILWTIDLKRSTASCALKRTGRTYELELLQDAERVASETFTTEAEARDWARDLQERLRSRELG